MCIAAVIWSPLTLKQLEAMHRGNPDGAGMAWVSPGAADVTFVRGLLPEDVHRIQATITHPYLLHFRWATRGESVAELTHPFPLGTRALFGELSGMCERVLIHNGTWNGFDKAIHQDRREFPAEFLDCQSDTAIAAWLTPENEALLDEVHWATAVGFVHNGTLDVVLRGTWYEHEGSWYSNLGWIEQRRWGSGNPYASSTYAACHGPVSGARGYAEWTDEDWEHWAAEKNNTSAATRLPPPPPPRAKASNELTRLLEAHEARREQIAEAARQGQYTSWEAYIRHRYGDDVAEDVMKTSSGSEDDGGYEDIISEDPCVVNSIIGRHM